ncbi:MAG: hypothetical protein HY820_46180 [Acidobacteria bacterium]|nr:hypothetical protein [Acidobacteriota bacterium]
MRRTARGHYRPPPLWRQLLGQLRGRDQMLVRGPETWPLLLLSFPRGHDDIATQLRDAWLNTLPLLRAPVVDPYRRMLAELPSMVVVLLDPRNICTCLGHFHPPGSESRLARRLRADTGGNLGELDLAWENIRDWRPHPLSSLAATTDAAGFSRLHFRAALLTVLLHELDHLAHPDHKEQTVRHSSDAFYTAVLDELLREEGSGSYGMSASA